MSVQSVDCQNKVALITGATGFIGSNLARQLLKEGWQVHIIARQQSQFAILEDILSKIKVHYHDGTTGGMFEILKNVKPGIVYHLASLFLARHRPDDIQPLIQSNITFGTQLVEAMVQNDVYCLINTGTFWQHFQNDDYNPVCLYAATKQAYEMILKYYLETTALKVITLKLYDTYGPNDPRKKLFALLETAAKEQQLLKMSPGEQLIDIVYIDDVVQAFILAAQRLQKQNKTNHEIYAVSSGNPISLKKLVAIYENVSGNKLDIQWGGRPYREREVMKPWDKGKWLPGWRPKYNLEQGIARILQFRSGAKP